MDTDVRWGPRLAALAILVALTGALVHSMAEQRVTAAQQLPPDEVQLRDACHERLARAVAEARKAGDVELADWIESLPIYNPSIPTDTPARPAAP
jgi:hypothetical protein